LDSAYVLLNSHARIVRDLLTKPGQTVEERRLTGIGRPDHGDERGVASFA